MNSYLRICLISFVAFALLLPLCTAQAETARGVVFHDANGNGRFEPGEPTLENMRVSNGRDVTKTDAEGRYELEVDNDDIVFVIKPSGWRTPLDENHLPRFYYIHKPAGSPESKFAGVAPTGPLPPSINFPLYPQSEPAQFRAILFGDPQPRNQKEVDYIAHDVVEELIGADASFGVTLGDIVFNDLNVFEPLNKTIAFIGIPWYNVIGNHDINMDAKTDAESDETFERIYGPAYYSFDYGQVHCLVVDEVQWHVAVEGKSGTYRGGLGVQQMEFIRNDLQQIPEDQLVMLLMHIPLVDVQDRQELYRLIEKRPFCISVSGHTHHHEHRFITKKDGWNGAEPHHHIINVTVCGSWWSGAPDERGIPHTTMADGAPNGYSIISFDGTKYTLDFKAAGRSADYQMQIVAPELVRADQLAESEVFVNVFNGSEKSKVEIQVADSDWLAMERVVQADPGLQAVFEAEEALLATQTPKPFTVIKKPKGSTHLWKATLPTGLAAGTHLIRIRAIDMHGRPNAASRVLRVAPAPVPAVPAAPAPTTP